MLQRIRINNLDVSFDSYKTLLQIVETACKDRSGRLSVGYVNAHTVVLAETDENVRNLLERFSILFSDGTGVYRAGKFLDDGSINLKITQNATEFNYLVMKLAGEKRLKIFFLGGSSETLTCIHERANREYEGITVAGLRDGYSPVNDEEVINEINNSRADIVMVGLGQPKQEIWIAANSAKLDAPVVIAVGGFLDFFGGTTRRAPAFLQRIGFEWFYRMLQEPGRLWRRYIFGIPRFCFIILRQKLKTK